MIKPKRTVSTVATARRRIRALALATLFTTLCIGLFAFTPTDSASAKEGPGSSPESSVAPTEPGPTDPQPEAPTIESPPDHAFVGSTTTTVSGTRGEKQEIQLLSPTGGDPLCIIDPDGSTAWSCDVRLPEGKTVTLKAVAVVTGMPYLSTEITVAVLGAPTVTGGPNGQGASNGIVRGTGYPGASVTVRVSTGQNCTSLADTSGAWSCAFTGLRSGTFPVTAMQKTRFSEPTSSNQSAPLAILFDLDRPAAPALTTPAEGTQVSATGTTYSGTGEDGATVTVFAGPYSLCSAVVTAGAWSCSGGTVAAGMHPVIALQQDAAGNVGPGSPAVSVAYVSAGTPPPGTPSPMPSGSSAQPAPVVPAPPAAAPSSPSPPPASALPAPSPEASEAGPSASSPATGWLAPGAWSDPTRFTAAVLPLGASAGIPWLQAAFLALAAVGLLAVPARLLAGTITRARNGRRLWDGVRLAGRNHARDEFETAPELHVNRKLVGAAALIAASSLVMLSGQVSDRPAYLRLLIAVVIALALVNAVGAFVPWWWSTHVLRAAASVTFLPRYLLLVGVTAVASRLFDVHPALLFGLLASVAMTTETTAAQRGQLAAVRAASLIVLALVGWLVLGVLPEAASGFFGVLVAEIVNTVVLSAIGSTVLVLMPIGYTSGRSILSWSPWVWAGLTLVAFTVLFVSLAPTVEAWQGEIAVSLLGVAVGAFASVSVAVWGWQRFVAPTLRS